MLKKQEYLGIVVIKINGIKEIAAMLECWWQKTWELSKGDINDDAWKLLYEKVFSNEISMSIYKQFPDFNYYDPDTSYYEDVTAFIDSFSEYSKKDDVD